MTEETPRKKALFYERLQEFDVLIGQLVKMREKNFGADLEDITAEDVAIVANITMRLSSGVDRLNGRVVKLLPPSEIDLVLSHGSSHHHA